MKSRTTPNPKPLFLERMRQLLPDKKDFQNYLSILKVSPVRSIRCNKLKISPQKLKSRLEARGWKISRPWKNYSEVMVIENILEPGELGRALEHQLGYYYIQELASMLPVIALTPRKDEIILDLCAAPGSKTTQLSSEMNATGTIIANEVSMGRLKILASNLERCGATNTLITRKDGFALCKRIKKYVRFPFRRPSDVHETSASPVILSGLASCEETASQEQEKKIQKNRLDCFEFDKILVDAPCSGEGTLRSSPKTYKMWNIKTIQNLPKIQRALVESALEILKPDGILIYSTCTHAPEENEDVVNSILEKFGNKIKLEKIKLPKEIKFREGLAEWENKKFSNEIKKCARVYPQDSNTEGFFIARFGKRK